MTYPKRPTIGEGFKGWTEVEGGGQTFGPLAVAPGRNGIYLLMRGLDGQIYLNQTTYGQPFGKWFPVKP